MWQLLGTFFERQLAHALCPIFCPFLHPVAWNLDVMAGTQATILGLEDKGHIQGMQWVERHMSFEDFVEQGHHINSGLPTLIPLCVREINSLVLSHYYFGPLSLIDELNLNWFRWDPMYKWKEWSLTADSSSNISESKGTGRGRWVDVVVRK